MPFLDVDTRGLWQTRTKGPLTVSDAVVVTFSTASALDTDFDGQLVRETHCRRKSPRFTQEAPSGSVLDAPFL